MSPARIKPVTSVTPSSELKVEHSITDMKLQLQQLLLSTDPVFQEKGSRGGQSDDFLEQLAPIIREALHFNGIPNLNETLEQVSRLKDRELESICSGDHNEYMGSVQQLGQVSREADTIKERILDANQLLEQSGLDLVGKKTKLLEATTTRQNVDSAIEAVTACLQVLELTNNVHQLIGEKRKFAALKGLDELQNTHLKGVAYFGFAQLINKSVPALTKMARNEVLQDFESWLTKVQQLSGKIGRDAFARMESQRAEWKKRVKENSHLKQYKFNSPVELAYRDSGVNYLDEDEGEDIDFSYLYECMLVHSSTGRFTEFQNFFVSDRKIQSNYLIPANMSLIKNENTGYAGVDGNENYNNDDYIENVLFNIAGFCILDRQVSRKVPTLRPSREVDDIWDSLCQKLNNTINLKITSIKNIDSLRNLKTLLGTFLHTMQNYRFKTTIIQQTILILFKRYSAFLRKEFDSNFFLTLQKDDYMPMVINTKDLYKKICTVSWYEGEVPMSEMVFPVTVPFSSIYPLCCAEIRTFINYHQSFLDELQQDPAQIEDILKEAVDDLLVKTVCTTFEDRLMSTTREQIVQILINLEYFQIASEHLEKKLADERISGRKGKVNLEATSAFAKARKKAEERIFELLNSVVDDFLDLADYNWNTDEKTEEPSVYLVDMVSFLKTMMNSTLVNLPRSIKSLVYFDAFDHLASSLLKLLMESSENLTLEAAGNFDIDVQYLEQFVNELGKDVNDMSLTTTITELRESVDLLLSETITEYNNPQVRMTKYGRVKPENAEILFAKINPARQRLLQQQTLLQEGTSSTLQRPNTPTLHTSSSTPGSGSNKFMKYYRTGVEKFNEKKERNG